MVKRIFAGLIVALLVSVCSLGAACELSCSLAQSGSDCHSQDAQNLASAGASLRTENMNMPMDGMDMTPLASNDGQPGLSAMPRANAGHAAIGEMGPCERQSCDSASAASTKPVRSALSQFHSALAAMEIPAIGGSPPAFHDALDEISPHLPLDASPLSLSLRI